MRNKPTNYQLFVVAECASESVFVGGQNILITKNVIGIMVVVLDLIICFGFWCSMISLGILQGATKNEISAGTVTAVDYTVVIKQQPHIEALEDLPGVYFAWVENINSMENEEFVDPNTGDVDENQNNVYNVNLGLTNMGYMWYMKEMGKLLVQKKRNDKSIRSMELE